eukprot:gene20276-7306_t
MGARSSGLADGLTRDAISATMEKDGENASMYCDAGQIRNYAL